MQSFNLSQIPCIIRSMEVLKGVDVMVSREVTILNKTGLHARPASKFVQVANDFESEIFIEKGSAKVNAKSIMGVMTLGASMGTTVTLVAEGEDENKAIDALIELIESKFGEE